MIAIDLDGTLLSPTGEVTARTKAAIHRALDAGLLICFATGRNFTESRAVLEAVAHHSTAVFVGGAMVMDCENKITLHRTMMEPSLAAEVCNEIESAGHAALALQDTNAAGLDYLVSSDVPMEAGSVRWMQRTVSKWRGVPHLAKHGHEHTIRVGMVAEPQQVAEVQQKLADRFGQRIYQQSVHVPGQSVEVLEVFDPSVNKWEGIKHVAAHHGIGHEQIVAIGDDVNDLHMLRHAGLGVAMGNAKPAVREIAKRVIGTNQNDGLAEFLDELIDQGQVLPDEHGRCERTRRL